MENIGLNLYSIRTLISTEEDFLATCKKLKEMGYTKIQYSGAAFDPDRIKRVSEEVSMPVVLTHVPIDRIINDTYNLMEDHKKFNCFEIGLGSLPWGAVLNEEECKEKIKKLNEAGRIMAENGFKFTYHHHHVEFYKFSNNETLFDYIIRTAPYINFTIDTYWLQYGGVDILSTLDKLKGRVQCVHLKDYKIFADKEKVDFKPDFAPCGSGTLDFKKIVSKLKEIGCEHFLVEQDNACELDHTMDLIKESIDYLKTI